MILGMPPKELAGSASAANNAGRTLDYGLLSKSPLVSNMDFELHRLVSPQGEVV
jgi:hypothetical protein